MSKTFIPTTKGQTTWYEANDLESKTHTDQFIVSLYFSLTMLSTVGYGDMYPLSNLERAVGVFLMMVGVAVFSCVMDEFVEIQTLFET